MATLTQQTLIADYTGFYELPNLQGSELTNFNVLNQNVQLDILLDLMGAYAYDDLATDPTKTIWTNVLNGVNSYLSSTNCYQRMAGIKEMLKGFVYFEYLWNYQYKITRSGLRQELMQNSEPAGDYQLLKRMYERWNKAVDHYDTVFDYMYTNESSYPEFISYHIDQEKKFFITQSNVL